MIQMITDTIAFFVFLIGSGVIASTVHKSKGYSRFTGFLLGLTIAGTVYVFIEKTKAETDAEKAHNIITMGQWITIFVGIGLIFISLFYLILNLSFSAQKTEMEKPYQQININYSSTLSINSNENLQSLYYYVDTDSDWISYTNDDGSLTYKRPKDGNTLNISSNTIDKDIESYMSERFKKNKSYKLLESKIVTINNINWHMFYYQIDEKDCNVFYITDYNNTRYEVEFNFEKRDHFSDGIHDISIIMNSMNFK